MPSADAHSAHLQQVQRIEHTGDRLQTVIHPLLSLSSVTQDVLRTLSASKDDQAGSVGNLSLLDLDKRLEEWRCSIAIPIRPLYGSHKMSVPGDPAQICLQMCYYQALLLIHRTSIPAIPLHMPHDGDATVSNGRNARDVQNLPGFKICVDVARETIRLVQNVPGEYQGFLR